MRPAHAGATIATALAVAFRVIAGVAAPVAGTWAQAPSGHAAYRPEREECAALRKINAYREKRGREPLAMSLALGAAAEHHSADMARRDYFAHDAPGGPSWDGNIRDHGYTGSPIGENIAAGMELAGAVVQAWKRSPGHRRTMLDGSFRAVGIGRSYDGRSGYGWYWTADFGGEVEREVSCRR